MHKQLQYYNYLLSTSAELIIWTSFSWSFGKFGMQIFFFKVRQTKVAPLTSK